MLLGKHWWQLFQNSALSNVHFQNENTLLLARMLKKKEKAHMTREMAPPTPTPAPRQDLWLVFECDNWEGLAPNKVWEGEMN